MEKLYDKIIPKEPDPIDNLIYYQCQVLDWTEPKHFISSKTNYVFDSFLPDAIHYFEEIEKQKSPRKKFIFVKKIFLHETNVGFFQSQYFIKIPNTE